jgi:hypothetical protein
MIFVTHAPLRAGQLRTHSRHQAVLKRGPHCNFFDAILFKRVSWALERQGQYGNPTQRREPHSAGNRADVHDAKHGHYGRLRAHTAVSQ